MTRHTLRGFTLIELLISTVILTSILGTLFSVLSTLRKSAAFRNDNLAVTQAANFSFEEIVRSIKSANVVESIWVPSEGRCETDRGYYILENGQIRADINFLNTSVIDLTPSQKLVTIQKEKINKPGVGQTYQYIKREYTIGSNDPDQNGNIYPTIIETTYTANRDPSINGGIGYEWPVYLWVGCNSQMTSTLHWDQASAKIRNLTGNDVRVSHFALRLLAPQVDVSNLQVINSPFVTIEITVENPKSQTVPPLTLHTTISPTFTYGDQRD